MAESPPAGERRSHIRWRRCYRITSLRSRPEAVFEQVVSPADLADVLDLLALGAPAASAPPTAAAGRGAGWIMLPFLRPAPWGGRFSAPGTGAYYAARALDTAVVETSFHWARFLRATKEPPTLIGLRALRAALNGHLVDIRGQQDSRPELYDPDPARYGPAQAWAGALRAAGAEGVVYDSVRHPGGECATVFAPGCLSNCESEAELAYEWDGERIAAVYDLRRRA